MFHISRNILISDILPDDPVYQHVVLGPPRDSEVNIWAVLDFAFLSVSQRSLTIWAVLDFVLFSHRGAWAAFCSPRLLCATPGWEKNKRRPLQNGRAIKLRWVGWSLKPSLPWCFECPVSHLQMIEGTYPPVSIFYWVRSLFSIALSLLLILVGFVLWPVHDVLKDESYWWTLKSFSINPVGCGGGLPHLTKRN